MISDTLSQAHTEIEWYLAEMPEVYKQFNFTPLLELIAQMRMTLVSLPTEIKQANPTDEIHKMLTLSTSHVTLKTAGDLEHKTDDLPPCWDKAGYGWFIVVPDDKGVPTPHTCPDDLKSVFTYARARGCTWVMLDSDGPVVDGLKTWEW
jgi:hypothetical protein